MTDLQAHKMPIIGGVNSTPSTEADPTHPNASLFCKQYNDLIDNLNGSRPLLTTSTSVYIDTVNGNDENNDGLSELTAFQTLERALDFFNQYTLNCNWIEFIFTNGTYNNPKFDFKNLELLNPVVCYVTTDGNGILSYTENAVVINKNNDLKLWFYSIEFHISTAFAINDINYFHCFLCNFNLLTLNAQVILNRSYAFFKSNNFINNSGVSKESCMTLWDSNIDIGGNSYNSNNFTYLIRAFRSTVYNTLGYNYSTGVRLFPFYYLEFSTAYIYYDRETASDFVLKGGSFVSSYSSLTLGTDTNDVDQKLKISNGTIETTKGSLALVPNSYEVGSGFTGTVKVRDANLNIGLSDVSINGPEHRGLYISGQKVVGNRASTIPDAISGTEITTINAILTALRTHGLINT